MKLLAAFVLLALTTPLAQARELQQAGTPPPPTCNVNYGAFGQSVAFIVAQAEGFFAEQGLTVCYNQVLSSPAQFAALYSGGYNIISTTTDNSINRYVNGEPAIPTAPKVQIVAAAGQGPGLALWGVKQFIPTLAAVKGQSVGVDAPNSGLVFTLRKLLAEKANLTSPPDYTFTPAGGTQQRLDRLVAGTLNATMLFSPFADAASTYPQLVELGKIVDVVPHLQLDGITTLRSYPTTEPGATIVPKFLAALVKGERFARRRRNRKATIADIAAVYPVKPEAFLDAILDPQTGENVDLQMNFKGLRAAVDLRQEFGGFGNNTVNSKALVKPAPDGLYFDKYLRKALRILSRQKGKGRNHGHHKPRRHHNDDD